MYPTKEPTEADYEVAERIEYCVNGVGLHPEGLVTALSRIHRTLQQHFTRICVAWFEYLAKLEDGEYDLRNEGSVKLAKELVKTNAWQKNGLPYV